MIAKIINTPVNFSSPFHYNEAKIEQGRGELLEKNFIGGSISTFRNTINLNKHVRNYKSNFLHISISPNDSDSLGKEQIKELGKEYLRRMGIDDNRPLLIYYHNDTAHPHIHILTTKIDYDGKKINDSFLKYRSKNVSRQIEQDLNLTPTKEIGKEKTTLSETQAKKHNPSFKSLKKKVKDAARQFSLSAENLSDFESKLTKNGIYIRKISNGKGLSYVYGINGQYFKESQLGRNYTLANIQNKIEGKITFTPEEQKKYLSQNINRVLKKSTNFNEFEKTLKKRGIEIKLYQNKGGIYGIGFSQTGIDNAKEFKGSEIDRRLSYNTIKNILSKNMSNKVEGDTFINKESLQTPVEKTVDYFTPTHLQKDQDEEFPWRKKRKNQPKKDV